MPALLRPSGAPVAVHDLQVGDRVLGPRGAVECTSVRKARSVMYEVRPFRGTPFLVGASQPLALVHTVTNRHFDCTVGEYQRLGKTQRARLKLYQAPQPVVFTGQPSPRLSPYLLGLWIGDGGKTRRTNGNLDGFRITTADPEVVEALRIEAALHPGVQLRGYFREDRCPDYYLVERGRAGNTLLDILRNATTQDCTATARYERGSRQTRYELLAGLLDSDGHLSRGTGFDFVQKSKPITMQLIFVAQSLGFRASLRSKWVNGEHFFRVHINGNTEKIPTRIPRKQASPRKQRKAVGRSGFVLRHAETQTIHRFTLTGGARYFRTDFSVGAPWRS